MSVPSTIDELVEEYEADETLEARLAHEADKLECVFQARDYQTHRAADTTQWINKVVSAAGRRLLDAAITLPPGSWWQEFHAKWAALTACSKPF